MMFAISSAISSLRLHVVRKSYKTISHHYCGCCMAVGWTLFWKKKSLGFVRLPQGLRTKSWNRLATISSQTSFLTCLLLGLKTAARQTHDDFLCWHPWWTCQLINTVKRGPYGIIIFIFLKSAPSLMYTSLSCVGRVSIVEESGWKLVFHWELYSLL